MEQQVPLAHLYKSVSERVSKRHESGLAIICAYKIL